MDTAKRLEEQYPELEVELFNVDDRKPRDEVFAVPTYMLDDEIVFLGNPSDEQIYELLEPRSK